jgi:antitoxin PrlF
MTSKAQTTVPQPVRAALRLQPGDEIAYVIADDKVIIAKATAPTAEDPFVTFEEWDSEADRKAYAGL